jgi:hypothetical protein
VWCSTVGQMVVAAAPNPVRGHVPVTSVDEKPRGEGGGCAHASSCVKKSSGGGKSSGGDDRCFL